MSDPLAPAVNRTPAAGAEGLGEAPSDLARRVLFSSDLTEKLRPLPLSAEPEPDADDERGQRWRGFVPSRPEGLGFAPVGSARPSLPGRPALVDASGRGVLLHFFANHELLAAELMALALLKFPEAPPEFRSGLAETLREEQRHTRWYLARLRECGVELGEYPLSGYFWEAVSPMESPLDYVSRLSLTFEQANLDYARHYAGLLEEAGDARSAAILRRIYRDEIAHVGYGLEWFRRWKSPGESDWDGLRRRLPFPLSPSRAKGNGTDFNAEGRRAAGFGEDYIRRLALFERSKGRTPDVFLFNPEAEHQAASWPRPHHPTAGQRAAIEDLELLAGFLAKRDDVLLLRREPSEGHLARLAACGLALPEIEALAPDGGLDPARLLASRKVHDLRPWSLAPDLPRRFAGLELRSSGGLALSPWTEERRKLFSKVEQARALARWMAPTFPCEDVASVQASLASLAARGCRALLVKRAYSNAGGGQIRTDAASLSAAGGRFPSPTALAEGGVLVEPEHRRVFDFSVQYEIGSGRVRLLGFVEQIVSDRGAYRGSVCRHKFCRGLEPELARFLMESCLPCYGEDGELADDLLAWTRGLGYEGPIGVDSYVHRDEAGRLRHRVVCEANARHTMGRVALELKRRLSPGCGLRLEMLRPAELASGLGEAELDKSGRLRSGSVALTEARPETRFVAVLRAFPPGADQFG